VTLSGDAEWPKVADAVIEAHFPTQNCGFYEFATSINPSVTSRKVTPRDGFSVGFGPQLADSHQA